MMHLGRSSSVALLVGLAFTTAVSGVAQADESAARALFDAAKQLMDEGKVAEACPKFAGASRLSGSASAEFRFADCEEKLGHTATAWTAYRTAAKRAQAKGETAGAEEATARASQLEPRLTRLTIQMAGSPPAGMKVERGGRATDPAEWNTAIPVDPGPIEVRASAEGYQSWAETVEAVGEGQTVSVRVPDLVAVTTAPTVEEPPAEEGEGSGRETAGLVIAGSGAAIAIFGGIFLGVAVSEHGSVDEDCPNDVCTADAFEVRESASSKATVAYVALGVGGAALVGGGVLWLTAPSESSTSSSSLVTRPRVGVGLGRISVAGQF